MYFVYYYNGNYIIQYIWEGKNADDLIQPIPFLFRLGISYSNTVLQVSVIVVLEKI